MTNEAIQEGYSSDQFSTFSSQNSKINYTYNKIREVKSYRVGELFSAYRDILWDDGRHKYNVSSFIGEIDEILLGERFSAFDQSTLDNLIGTLRQRGNSNATINRKMAALSKLLRKAYKMGDVHSLPEFRRQKERAGRIRFLERDEEARLFAAIKSRSEDAYRLSVFLVDTGCRLGEALGLIWNDIQEHRVSFWITKSGRSRTIPMTERVKEVIKLPPSEGRRPKGPFTKLSQAQYRAIWNDAKAEVGLGADDQVVPHILRHTCASRLVQGGIDIRRVQMWLGHQTLSMTMRYAHLATNDLDGCVVVLEKPRCEQSASDTETSVFSSPVTTPSPGKAERKQGDARKISPKAPRKNSKAK
ncbi:MULTISPECIES: tyrosine-type recombinase/integrase [unclassified Mesorhizobium]|uniref:tyrosine-type recombinase/integrase n=1 Tax=unclassified Mesorhizobium TaxID=325217 RepID=UPI001CCA97BD|nr:MULTISPECIES: site-specific integrase [unclassified Mesorhizobium]MBZ9741127.1 site-specific integrase [Mesorhizobium sp. CO1-1-4]MBZ9804265.1 site-specific integrase [Mesorhizobium sp. ES1-6]